jgi:hypothetical protein
MGNADLKFHPLADIFPLMEGQEFDELVADIEKNGLEENIVLYEDKILDGRNRYRACKAAGVSYFSSTYVDDDPVGFVISHNLRRRHLNESQRAMIAAKLATLRRGDNQHTEGLPIGRSSELLNVSERSIARAREVLDKGPPELAAAVGRGEVSVSAAAKIAAKSLAARNGCIPDGTLKDIERGLRKDRKLEHFLEGVCHVCASAAATDEVSIPEGLTAERAAECVGKIEEAIKQLRLFKKKLAAIAQSHESQIDAPRPSIDPTHAFVPQGSAEIPIEQRTAEHVALDEIPDDLSIPAFMQRRPVS